MNEDCMWSPMILCYTGRTKYVYDLVYMDNEKCVTITETKGLYSRVENVLVMGHVVYDDKEGVNYKGGRKPSLLFHTLQPLCITV